MNRHTVKHDMLPSAAWAICIAAAVLPIAAEAYVGPGAGLSLLSALWGLICAIGAAFLFVILWPIRRMRRKRREARGEQKPAPVEQRTHDTASHTSNTGAATGSGQETRPSEDR